MNPTAEDERLAAVADELAAHAESPAELDGQPGTFRTATKVFAVISLLSVIAIVVGEGVLLGVGITFAIIGIITLLVIGITDLVLPKARDRNSSSKAVDAYFRCMQKGRWDAAFATLAPPAREETITTPEVKEFKAFPKTATRSSVKELKKYWKAFTGSSAGQNRRLAKIEVTPIETEGPIHRHRVELQIDYYPSWAVLGILIALWPAIILILVLTKKYKTTFDVTTVKYKSQWWVLDGEFKPPRQAIGANANLPRARVV